MAGAGGGGITGESGVCPRDGRRKRLDGKAWLEILGYVASLVLLASLVTTNVFRLRVLNGIGCVLFGVYGLMIRSWPVCAINWVMACVDLWYLMQAMANAAFFELDRVGAGEGRYLRKFFLYHELDIRSFHPELTLEALEGAETMMLYRNMMPVGLFAFRREGEEARILVDYSVPEYRDFKAGRFLYRVQRMRFKEEGIKRFTAAAEAGTAPAKYYRKNGFKAGEDGVWTLEL